MGWQGRVCLLVATVCLAGGIAAAGDEQPRNAVVDIQELFRSYHKVSAAQEEINLERARIERQNREILQRLDEMKEGIEALKRKLASPALQGPVVAGERKAVEQELFIRGQEYASLEAKRRQEIEMRNRRLNDHMMARMGALLDEIRRSVETAGERAGFDYVFDRAGLNTSHVPPVLYAREATDITAIVLKELNKNAPQGR